MSATDPHQAFHRTIEAVWRIESARVIAGLTRLTRDVGLAEDLAQEALVAALEQWPQSGVPDNPAAWLTTTAKRRAIDLFRRNAVAGRKHEELARELEALEQTSPDLDSTLDNTISDDLLRLVFIACHPILPTESRAALTLRVLGGLTTDEIARAFLTPEPTIAQRIVRAKRTQPPVPTKAAAFDRRVAAFRHESVAAFFRVPHWRKWHYRLRALVCACPPMHESNTLGYFGEVIASSCSPLGGYLAE